MDDLTALFDQLLIYTAAYPVTLLNLIASPSLLFHAPTPERLCPASVTYLFTVAISYYWFKLSHPEVFEKLPTWVDAKLLVVAAAAYVATIVNLQQIGVATAGEIANATTPAQLKALTYAVCPVLLLSIIVEECSLRFSSQFRKTYIAVHGLYLWCLFNVCRSAFGFDTRTAAIGSAYAYAWFIGFIVVLSVVVFFIWNMRTKSSQSN